MDFLLRQVPSLLWRSRETLAHYLGSPPQRLVFAASVSAAVNLIASSLELPAPGEILLSDQEYLTMRWCWERVAQRRGLTLRVFSLPSMPSDPQEITSAVVRAMGRQTRVIFFSHIVSATGLILPARQICEEAQRRGIVSVVDGAHAPACIALTLADIPCDFYVGSGHKWLLAPSGTAFLYLGRAAEDRLQPLTISWGHYSARRDLLPDERDEFGSTPRLRRLECEGTRDICSWLAIPASIDFHKSWGPARIIAHARGLADYARQRLTAAGNLTPATPADPALSSPMIAFNLPDGTRPIQLQRELWERFRIEVAVIDRPNQPMLRLSPHLYNCAADIDHLAQSLETLTQ
jgi:isopenicillin-N epimerase